MDMLQIKYVILKINSKLFYSLGTHIKLLVRKPTLLYKILKSTYNIQFNRQTALYTQPTTRYLDELHRELLRDLNNYNINIAN